MSAIAPGSLVVLRLPSDLAAGATVVVTALIARELGGSRGAQLLAAGGAALATLVQATGHLLSTATFNLTISTVIAWLVIRVLRTADSRLWLVIGLVSGVGLNDNDLTAFLIGSDRPRNRGGRPPSHLPVRMALPGRRIGRADVDSLPRLAGAPWLAGALDRPRDRQRGFRHFRPALELLPQQLVLVSPYLAPVWIAGLVRLLRNPTMRWCRSLGIAWILLAAVFLATGGKPYYLGALLPLLLAAGAEPTIAWARRRRRRRLALALALVLSLSALPVTLPLVPLSVLHDTPIVSLNYDAGETVGWPRMVSEIANVYAMIPQRSRSSTALVASNYGEAGAIDRYGPAHGLPHAYGVQNAYWLWGPPSPTATSALAIGFDRASLQGVCTKLSLLTRLDNGHSVDNDEQGAPVWLCSNLTEPWHSIWRRLRDYG